MTISRKLGNKIRHLRSLKNYSQENMAELLEMSPSGYARIEQGKTDVQVSRLEKIAKILEIPLEELMKLDDAGNITINSPHAHSYNGDNIAVNHVSPEAFRQLEQTVRNLERLVGFLVEKMEKAEKE